MCGIYDVKEQAVITTVVAIWGNEYLLGLICIYSWFNQFTLYFSVQPEDEAGDDVGGVAGVVVPDRAGGGRGVAPGPAHQGAPGHEGHGHLRPGESHHLRLSDPR